MPIAGPPESFLPAAAGLGIEFEPGDVERLRAFLDLLLEANKTTNLTAIRDPQEAWTKHILDAMTLVPVVASLGEGREEVSVIDVGSGGGVPGMPLAIVMPSVRFTLLEATGKKAAFLRAAAEQLGLKNVTVLNERAERAGQSHREEGHREKFDVAIARALGHLAVVAELCAPLVRPGGWVLAVKGAKAEQELEESGKALGLVGLRHARTEQTPTGRIVLLEKTTRTPRTYPRKDGEPSRVPLGLERKK